MYVHNSKAKIKNIEVSEIKWKPNDRKKET